MTLRALRAHLTPFRIRSLRSAILHVVVTFGLWGASSFGAMRLSFAPERLFLGMAAGVFSGTLFMVGHDACHGSYTHVRRLNEVLGRLVFLPSYHTYSLWDLSHNRTHHIYTNLKGRDFVWLPLSKSEFDTLPGWRRFLYRVYRTPLGLALYYPIDLWWVRLFFPRPEMLDRPRRVYTLDSCLVAAFMLLQLGTAVALRHASVLDALGAVGFGVFLPWMVFNWMIGFVIYFNHTHPAVPWFATREEWSAFAGMVEGTARLKFPGWTLFFASNIMDHVAHHVDPRIPLVHLRRAQERIEEVLPGRVVVQEWSVAALLDIIRRCKLYDYEAHRWVNYEGKPTAERALSSPNARLAERAESDGVHQPGLPEPELAPLSFTEGSFATKS